MSDERVEAGATRGERDPSSDAARMNHLASLKYFCVGLGPYGLCGWGVTLEYGGGAYTAKTLRGAIDLAMLTDAETQQRSQDGEAQPEREAKP